ncbi:MAG: isoprenylcysteine carboxylmethyltransferase family protein [Pseudorhodoplanes sp.]
MLWTSVALLGFVTLQRLAELVYARRNTARLLACGAREVAPGHYPYMVAMHACWLAGLWWLAPYRPLEWFWLSVFALAQVMRVWVLQSLGSRWTTRIIVVPEGPLVASGPYRFLSHPNYVIVAVELASLPLAFGLVGYAIIFSLLNAAMLFVRIRTEDAALREA